MTIAHIRSHLLRRTLIVVLVPLAPLVFIGISLVSAGRAFVDELRSQWGQGSGGLWPAIRDCWNGADVRRPPPAVD